MLKPQLLKRKSRIVGATLAVVLLALAVALLGLLLGDMWNMRNNTPGNPRNGNPGHDSMPGLQINKGSVSPLLFGTNLSLFDSNDQVLSSASTRRQLQQLHFRIMRMPVRPGLANDTEIQAAQAIKSMGAYALVVLRGTVDANVLADDTRLVNDMNSVFGKSVVFYEYGNEEDLQGIDVDHYTDSWNSIVPQLKRIAVNAQFIGPVNYHYDRDYLATFLLHANPHPDEVSWHEYTCADAQPDATCISHLENWTRHISDARKVMRAAIGTTLPIMITEWNFAPDAHANDGKISDSSFMSAWTSRAMETLAANRVFASMQYACTNSVYAAVRGDGTPTAQGLAMQALYERMIIRGEQPTPVSSSTL